MKLKRPIILFNVALAIGAASFIFFLSQRGILERPELDSLDLSFRLRGALLSNPRIIIIEISDYDIAKIGRWPWKRSWHAAMSEALSGLGAKYIYFDILFSEPSAEEDDALFEASIKQTKNIYLPFVFQGSSFNIKNAIIPLKRFASYIKGTGAINIYPDEDGTIRRIPLVFSEGGNIYPHAALKLAMDYNGMEIKEIKPDYIILANQKGYIRIPLVEKNTMLINWLGKWKRTFKHYSFLDVLAGYKDFLDHKTPHININDFKGSICLVAATAAGLYDIKPTPLEPAYPGIGTVANVISGILDKNFLYVPPPGVNILILYLLAFIPSFLIFGEKPFREVAFVFLTAGIYFSINSLLFKKGIRLELFSPLLGLFSSYFTVGTYNFIRISIERQRFFRTSITDGLTGLYNIRYFKVLLGTEIMLAQSDPAKRFSILMGDIDHFKRFNDTYGHQTGDLVLKEVANTLKASARSSDIVARYGGEEMIILLRGAALNNGLSVAEKIRRAIEEHVVGDEHGNTYKVTASIGVSVFKAGDNVDTVIKRADEGLYKAKEAGRNRVSTVEAEPAS